MKYSVLRLLKLVCFLFLFCFSLNTFGQSLEELRKQKEKTASEIEYINNLLKETNSNAKASLNRLAVLERQIKLQNRLIDNITGEIGYLANSIQQNSQRIDSLSAALESVKRKYASMIRYAYRNQNSNNQMLFLFSAQDFNQAYKRFIYLKEYADYRRKQAERITDFKNSISNELLEYNKRKEEKQNLLVSKVSQTKIIEQQQEQQNTVYSELQQKEKDLRRKLENQRKAEVQLEQAIERVVASVAQEADRDA